MYAVISSVQPILVLIADTDISAVIYHFYIYIYMNKNGSTHCKAISRTFVCIGNNNVKVILI